MSRRFRIGYCTLVRMFHCRWLMLITYMEKEEVEITYSGVIKITNIQLRCVRGKGEIFTLVIMVIFSCWENAMNAC
jgi:hypothetical protein